MVRRMRAAGGAEVGITGTLCAAVAAGGLCVSAEARNNASSASG